ncbi:MAG: DUF1015 family protein [Firmicutes bacterium]|nr:DUF1015 family protein [Bacillota bacterium]
MIEFPVPGGAGGAASPRDLLNVSLLHRYLLPLLWKDREPGEALVPGDARITGETPAAGEKLVPGKALVPGHAQSVSQHGGFQGPASRERDLEKPVVSYTRDAREAYRAASVSDGTAAFLLLPPKVEEIIAVASAGGRMPEKSTYFYPKPVSGLVFYQPD